MGAGESGMLSPGPLTHDPLARAARPIGSVPCHYFPRVRLAIRLFSLTVLRMLNEGALCVLRT